MRFANLVRLAVTVVFAVGVISACGGSSNAASHSSNGGRTLAERLHQRELANLMCSLAVASSPELSTPVSFVPVGGTPFGISVTPDGRWAFVDGTQGRVTLMSIQAGGVPRTVKTIALPGPAVGSALTDDGRYLLAASGSGAIVVSVSGAEHGSRVAVLGTLHEPGAGRFGGAIEVIGSLDGHYVFVSNEDAGQIAVYDLQRAISTNFRTSGFIGTIQLGHAVVGSAISPNGRWLYVTSELAARATSLHSGGTLSVINLAAAEHDPAKSVVATVGAHCSPVRVAVSPDGATVWVTARESDQLLAFSANKLTVDPAHALIAAVRVGEAPVGLKLVDNGRLIVVADSNRFDAPGQHSALTVLNTADVLAHRPAILGTLRAGLFPREMALEPDGQTLLVGNFESGSIEVVPVNKLTQ